MRLLTFNWKFIILFQNELLLHKQNRRNLSLRSSFNCSITITERISLSVPAYSIPERSTDHSLCPIIFSGHCLPCRECGKKTWQSSLLIFTLFGFSHLPPAKWDSHSIFHPRDASSSSSKCKSVLFHFGSVIGVTTPTPGEWNPWMVEA